jgi:putative transposase
MSVTSSETRIPSDRTVIQAYRFALEPTPQQVQMLLSHCGAQRFAYNWALRMVKANLEQRAAERTYGLDGQQLTPSLDWSAYGLRRQWNRVKDVTAPWWPENSKEPYSSGLANFSLALRNWASSVTGDRSGRRVGFPVAKTRRSSMSCRFTTGAFGLTDSDRRHVRLPRIGKVRTSESTRKLARRIESGRARIRSATVSYVRGRWCVAFSVAVQKTRCPRALRIPVVGVDLGLRHLAVLSEPVTGVSDHQGFVANPNHLEKSLRAMRRLQRRASRRQGPDNLIESGPSKRWLCTQAKIIRQHAKVANARTDAIHQLTTGLSRSADVIVIEDLNVAGMVRNRCLSRRISGASWGELRRQLAYKTLWQGAHLVVADRFFPSTKTCSSCGAVKAKLRPSITLYSCDICGLSIDRDVNAARNLAALVRRGDMSSSPSCGETENEPDGNSCKSRASGDEYCHGKPVSGNVT